MRWTQKIRHPRQSWVDTIMSLETSPSLTRTRIPEVSKPPTWNPIEKKPAARTRTRKPSLISGLI